MAPRGGPYPYLRLDLHVKVDEGMRIAELVQSGLSFRAIADITGCPQPPAGAGTGSSRTGHCPASTASPSRPSRRSGARELARVAGRGSVRSTRAAGPGRSPD